jgi:hypothetical protein
MNDRVTTAAGLPPANTANVATRGKYLSVTSIGLMTAAAVVTSLRGLPLLAKEEMTMFVYLAFTVVFYLIPASLN